LIVKVVISSVLEGFFLISSRVIIESNNFLENRDFFRDIVVLFLVFLSLISKFLDSSSKLTFKSDFFRVALIDISLSGSNGSDEISDFLFNGDEIFFVDLDLLLEFQFEVSSGNVRVDLIFLSLSDLSLNGGFKVVKELKKFSFNLSPSFSLSVLECIEFEVSLVVINVTRADFIS